MDRMELTVSKFQTAVKGIADKVRTVSGVVIAVGVAIGTAAVSAKLVSVTRARVMPFT
jgi:hypothetical protein